ncbi:MAG: hypothetical protein ACE5IR_17875 [bacterium]
MQRNLSETELEGLIRTIFAPTPEDKKLAFLIDVPNARVSDSDAWQDRRQIAWEWYETLHRVKMDLDLAEISFFCFENTGSNNADLPESMTRCTSCPDQVTSAQLVSKGPGVRLERVLSQSDIVFALTEFSATAPLKVFAKKFGFRAATMPGFSREMIPALSVDYEKVHEQVLKIRSKLDEAIAIEINFLVENQTYEFFVDIRYRSGFASSGLLRTRGIAGNLPSGEAYIVPYEGELAKESKTAGLLPVQFGDEIVVYKIERNRAIDVLSRGAKSEVEKNKLATEPAYGNIAEIGFGVLRPFGIKPIGVVLLDEKLGLHIAFGRSDHFGGATSPQHFFDSNNVVHIDRIYIPEVQDKITTKKVVLEYPDKQREEMIRDGEYLI